MLKHLNLSIASRHKKLVSKENLWKQFPYNSIRIPNHSGRNNSGHITIRHRGGQYCNHIRIIQHNLQTQLTQFSSIWRIETDPLRTGWLSLRKQSKFTYYTMNYENQKQSNTFNSLQIWQLKELKKGTKICYLEKFPNEGSKYIRSAGTFGILSNFKNGYAYVYIPSKKYIRVSDHCRAYLGEISVKSHQNETLGIAGIIRRKKRRPVVTGESINAVDHPHGGRTKSGRQKKTPWGKLALGFKTVRKLKF